MSRLKTDAIRNVNASVDGITLDTSGNVAIPNELQLADKIVHTGDTNTAIRFLANDTVSVETGAAERFRITSDGSVMFGSGVPSEDLHLKRARANFLVEGTNDTVGGNVANINVRAPYYRRAGYSISDTGGNEDFWIGRPYGEGDSNAGVAINMGGVEKLRFTSEGRVGINRTSPAELLDVYGTIQCSGAGLKIDTHPIVSYASFTDISGGSYAARLGSTGSSTIRSTQIYGGGSHIATFDGVNTRLGIGTTTPSSKISAKGNETAYAGNYAVGAVLTLEDSIGRKAQFIAPGSQGDAGVGTVSNNHFNLITGNATKATINHTTGNFEITDGDLKVASGHGIDFSADGHGSGVDDELLNDYEEGDWTPTPAITHQGGSASLSSISGQYGRYVKIGRKVTVWFRFQFTASNISGSNVGVNGLPFTISNDGQWNNEFHGGIARRGIIGGETYICEGLYKNTANIQVLRRYDNTGMSNSAQSMGGTACYLVD